MIARFSWRLRRPPSWIVPNVENAYVAVNPRTGESVLFTAKSPEAAQRRIVRAWVVGRP
jgi:hypothetical protein